MLYIEVLVFFWRFLFHSMAEFDMFLLIGVLLLFCYCYEEIVFHCCSLETQTSQFIHIALRVTTDCRKFSKAMT